MELAPAAHKPATRQLLQEMFPTLDWVFTRTHYEQPIQLRWLIDSRICCDEVFDRYFEMSIPTQELPNSLLHEFARQITEPEDFAALLCTFEDNRQAEILQRLLGLVDEFPLDQSVTVVQTLLRAGGQVSRCMSHTHWSPREQIVRLLRVFLKRHPLESARSQLVIEAFRAVPSLAVAHQLVGADYALRRRGDIGMFDDVGLEQLKSEYLCIVSQMADGDPDAFLADEDLPSYLNDLNQYSAGGDEGRGWVGRHVTSATRFLHFARGFTSFRTTSSSSGISRAAYISPSTLEYMMGLTLCTEWVAQLESQVLSEADLETLALVKDALSLHVPDETAMQE
ncbi:hypothetical protein ACTABV_08850 [Pseudomonas fragariae (ex Marin et al. 2024)]|uniref:hypothetical protein n=1 Tax=Pseudomonas fragariae (ex Marin et al. 2024) TaxID=3080056 RepID=UPI003F84D34B